MKKFVSFCGGFLIGAWAMYTIGLSFITAAICDGLNLKRRYEYDSIRRTTRDLRYHNYRKG